MSRPVLPTDNKSVILLAATAYIQSIYSEVQLEVILCVDVQMVWEEKE